MSPTDPQQIILASLAQHHSPLMQCLLCRSHRQRVYLFIMQPRPPKSTLLPHTPLFRTSTVWMAAHSRPQQHSLASLRDCIMSPTDPQQIILRSEERHEGKESKSRWSRYH